MADNITAPGVGTVFAADDISGVFYPRTKISFGVDGSATDVSSAAPLPVTLGLTDTQLRATPVPISGAVTTGGLTDTQLRATALPVSFTGQSVGITGSVAVTGTFWQATQPVSIAALPLPSGAATSAAQTTGNASLAGIDGKLSAPLPIAANGRTICEYTTADGIRPAVVAATNSFVLPTLGASRSVLLVANVRTFIRTGTSGVTATVGAQSIPIPVDVPFHLLIPAGHTHIAVIRDGAADGAISVIRAID